MVSALATAPRLRFEVPEHWSVSAAEETVWEAGLPYNRQLGTLASALSLDVLVNGEPVRAAGSVMITNPCRLSASEITAKARELEGCQPDAAAWIDLPIGRAFRTQVFSSGPRTKVGAPGPHASVRYLIPKDDWLVVLTFDTPSPRWALLLVEAFDEIAIRATWAR
jgi:hypothetical protein